MFMTSFVGTVMLSSYLDNKGHSSADNVAKFGGYLSSGFGVGSYMYYQDKQIQIAVAIQFLRDNPDLLKVSKQISRRYSRSHSKTKRRRSS